MKGYREVANYFLRVFLASRVAMEKSCTKKKSSAMTEKKKQRKSLRE